ncbi:MULTISPECIES: homoserine O-acetyltransferase [unclassified Fibrobacter]|uniref:homoserine O-acetyltransferase MetX n=1 Tax=unclassified Fibrobacter TaxID=2634177 RepID=UPI000D6C59DA|nr:MULTISPECIES: homoserine O-acetyltransferase [unclassified Fibrobacter]PWJ62102.1 homoserine O-acetyltransferase [Fibrobacter sp. UWR4]PZW67499.1 homoserine O-acetyltransferase [Fibrobacter sp. UWR1]
MSEFLLKNSIGPVVPQTFVKDYGEQGFMLENGKTLPALEIRYETYGKLNAERNNTVWVTSPLTADAHVAGYYTPEDKKPGWWDALIGPGKPVDTDRFFVVCSNILGGCKGSTGPASINPRTGKPYGSTFPTITIGDMVHAQKELADYLGIKDIYCVIGGSMGGFQAMKWAIYYPEQVKRCVLIATSPRFSSQALGFEIVARDVITQDPNYNNGDYYETAHPDVGLSNARKLAHITYLSAVGMEKKFKRAQDHEHRNHAITYSTPFDLDLPLESYLRYQGAKFVDRFDANSYLHIAHATDCFDLETEYGSLENAFKDVKAEVLNVNLSTDWLFPPHESRRITSALLNSGKVVTSLELDTLFGHDGFLIEDEDLGKAVGRFLDSKYGALTGKQTIPVFHDQQDFELLGSMVTDGAKVLDLGCGSGDLIDYLRRTKNATGLGIEKRMKDIMDCLENDVPVVQRDLDERGISDIKDDSYDYAIINRTIQEIRDPVALLNEILRVAKRVIVTFPNFGHWSARGSLMLHGRMPKSKELPYEWYNTPNIRLLTVKDFYTLCEKEGLKIEKMAFQNEQLMSKILTALGQKNFGAEHVIAMVSKKV